MNVAAAPLGHRGDTISSLSTSCSLISPPLDRALVEKLLLWLQGN
jgi:hypothetical protein